MLTTEVLLQLQSLVTMTNKMAKLNEKNNNTNMTKSATGPQNMRGPQKLVHRNLKQKKTKEIKNSQKFSDEKLI